MEAYYFVEEFPLALEYGMTPHQYWEEEPEMFFAYQKAYINRQHNQAHINGVYINLALGVTLGNAFKKKEDKALEYPSTSVYNPFQQKAVKTQNKPQIQEVNQERINMMMKNPRNRRKEEIK